jgi:hypothetical protein
VSIGTVKDRLVEILTVALPDTQVIVGPADVTTLRNRALVVGGESTPIDLQVSAFDASSSTATYTLMLTASVSLPGTDESMAEDQAVADFAAAAAAIQADQNLGLENVSATVTGAGELVESSAASGRSAAVRFPVVIFSIV